MIRKFIALLRHLGLSESSITELARVAVFRNIHPGDVISKKMDRPTSLIYIHSGFVALRSQKKNSTDNIYSFYTSDTLINENPALTHIRQVVDFVAITNCTLVYVPLSLYWSYIQTEGRFVNGLLDFTIQRNNRLKLACAILRYGSPTFRIIVAMAHHALVLNNEAERENPESILNDNAFLNISHSLMSSMVSVSRGIFYKHLKSFEEAGFIKLEYRKMFFGSLRVLWIDILKEVYQSGAIDDSMTLKQGIDWLSNRSQRLKLL